MPKPHRRLDSEYRFVGLVRDTTWKCGHLEKAVVNTLKELLSRPPWVRTGYAPLRSLVERMVSEGFSKSAVLEALARLSKRRVVKLIK